MRGRSRWRHSGRGVAIVGLLAVLTVGCTVGPAADRAARMGPVEPTDDGGGPPGQNGDPTDEPTGDSTSPPVQENPAPADASGTVDSVRRANGIEDPCCVAELPGGDLLVGTRDSATLYRVSNGEVTPVGELRTLTLSDDRALLDLAVDPESTDDIVVYAYYSRDSEDRVGSYSYDEEDAPGDQLTPGDESLLEDLPSSGSGGSLAFGPDGALYLGAGDQVLRMDSSGDIPSDNPTPGSAVYASGFADVQGFAWDPVGRLWVVDVQGDETVLSMVSRDAQDGTVAPAMEVWRAPPGEAFGPMSLAYNEDSRSLWLSMATDEGVWRIPLDGEGGVVEPGPEVLVDDGMAGVVDIVPNVSAGDHLWALVSDGGVLDLAVS